MTRHLLDHALVRSRLEGRTALVTGAVKRVGRACYRPLRRGVQIVAHNRKALEEETNKTCSEVNECGARYWKVLADVERPEEYEGLIGRAIREAGTLVILINNASIFTPGGLQEVSFPDLTKQVQVPGLPLFSPGSSPGADAAREDREPSRHQDSRARADPHSLVRNLSSLANTLDRLS
ncbi:MAG: hypothetical protein A2078_02175 [Nitrospirae bacterium GWC2_57_9]|nr:MAG: hypothetical protein A2078_02175 [Nitrospirae bacterium GWC2_57_9]